MTYAVIILAMLGIVLILSARKETPTKRKGRTLLGAALMALGLVLAVIDAIQD